MSNLIENRVNSYSKFAKDFLNCFEKNKQV